jgi:MOSC domain-containing protein YiiM
MGKGKGKGRGKRGEPGDLPFPCDPWSGFHYALRMSRVLSVSLSPVHGFSKAVASEIALLAGLGVEGDAHAGVTVRHRYRVRKDPAAPNLCQVHLLQAELFGELAEKGIAVAAGEMGENVTTLGIDLLGLPRGTRLRLGESAVVEVTGLREPCAQMNGLRPGLMKACLARAADGALVRKAGIMGIVLTGGVVRAGDRIAVELPPGEPLPLLPV